MHDLRTFNIVEDGGQVTFDTILPVGTAEGWRVGIDVGWSVGNGEGWGVGRALGCDVGVLDG